MGFRFLLLGMKSVEFSKTAGTMLSAICLTFTQKKAGSCGKIKASFCSYLLHLPLLLLDDLVQQGLKTVLKGGGRQKRFVRVNKLSLIKL